MRFLLAAFSILYLLKPTLRGGLNDDGDFQFWHYLSIEKALERAWSSRLIGVMRWGDDASKFYFAYGQWQAVYTGKYFEIAPGYRQEYFRPDHEWLTRYNPLVDVTFFSPFCVPVLSQGLWRWEDRSRIVYHVPQHFSGAWIYRNRLRFTTPQLTCFLKLRLFADDEIFFHEGLGCNQNRVSIGLFGEPTSYLKGRLYYMYRSLKRDHIWSYQNVLAFHIYF